MSYETDPDPQLMNPDNWNGVSIYNPEHFRPGRVDKLGETGEGVSSIESSEGYLNRKEADTVRQSLIEGLGKVASQDSISATYSEGTVFAPEKNFMPDGSLILVERHEMSRLDSHVTSTFRGVNSLIYERQLEIGTILSRPEGRIIHLLATDRIQVSANRKYNVEKRDIKNSRFTAAPIEVGKPHLQARLIYDGTPLYIAKKISCIDVLRLSEINRPNKRTKRKLPEALAQKFAEIANRGLGLPVAI